VGEGEALDPQLPNGLGAEGWHNADGWYLKIFGSRRWWRFVLFGSCFPGCADGFVRCGGIHAGNGCPSDGLEGIGGWYGIAGTV